MTQENKELLLKDLCARLPYSVIIEIQGHYDGERFIRESEFDNTMLGYLYDDETIIKPYLRPMSSMTDEERKYYNAIVRLVQDGEVYEYEAVDWLNSHHFDYRGLIEKGLALEAPEEMYKED